MNILLTGFGPFGDVVDNPTERLVRHFERHGIPGHRLKTCVLPVSYSRAPGLLIEAIEQGSDLGSPFDLVWMLGVASISRGWRVERFGRNENSSALDADDFLPPPRIDPSGPAILEATVPVELLASELAKAGLPASLSDSAGAYLCNHALYTALRHLRQSGSRALAGFLHVPADDITLERGASPPAVFPFVQHVRAVTVTLEVLATVVR